jgi:hypothetical protein
VPSRSKTTVFMKLPLGGTSPVDVAGRNLV